MEPPCALRGLVRAGCGSRLPDLDVLADGELAEPHLAALRPGDLEARLASCLLRQVEVAGVDEGDGPCRRRQRDRAPAAAVRAVVADEHPDVLGRLLGWLEQ